MVAGDRPEGDTPGLACFEFCGRVHGLERRLAHVCELGVQSLALLCERRWLDDVEADQRLHRVQQPLGSPASTSTTSPVLPLLMGCVAKFPT